MSLILLQTLFLLTALVISPYLENNPTKLEPPSDYLAPSAPPGLRTPYNDPVFNQTLMRFTNAGGLAQRTTIYSTMTAFNQSKTKMMVVHGGVGIAIYDLTTGQSVTPAVAIPDNQEPVWSRRDEDVIYYMPTSTPLQLKKYDVSSGQQTNVGGTWTYNGHTYDRFYNTGEQDICFGGGHIVKLVGATVNGQVRNYIVLYSLITNAIVAEYDMTTDAAGNPISVNGVQIGPALAAADRSADTKDILLVTFNYAEPGAPDYPVGEYGKGMWEFNWNPANSVVTNPWTVGQQVTPSNSHYDVGLDTDGSPVIVAPDGGIFPQHVKPGCQVGGSSVEKIYLANPDVVNRHLASSTSNVCMLKIPWGNSMHVTFPDQTGWVFLDAYSTAIPSETSWTAFTNELIQIRLDSNINTTQTYRRLAHHRSRLSDDAAQYTWQPKASVSRDGTKLAFTSNWGYGPKDANGNTIIPIPRGYLDVYLMDGIDVTFGNSFTLTVSKGGNGNGTVSGYPGDLYCGIAASSCLAALRTGVETTLNAVPANGSTFGGWTGACKGTATCVITMDQDKNVGATFCSGNRPPRNGNSNAPAAEKSTGCRPT